MKLTDTPLTVEISFEQSLNTSISLTAVIERILGTQTPHHEEYIDTQY